MKKILPLLLIATLLLSGGCASKRYARKGAKYDKAGMYELAAEMYYKSMVANPKNIDAAIGLKKNGQRLLDDKILAVHQAYSAGNDKETVYKFLDAKAYRDKVNATGVQISYPERTEGYFNEAKPRYLAKLYNEARILLDEEKFKESELLFAEIKSIDPGYQGVDEHLKISVCEPLYREGVEFLANGFYRKAYANFNNIIVNHGSYKDSKELRDNALEKGMITIEIATITTKPKLEGTIAASLYSKINSSIIALNNPFVKIVDTKQTKAFVEQQTKGTNVEVGKLLAAKAILSGSINSFTKKEGDLVKTLKKGYLKEEYVEKDKQTGEEKKKTRYHKVNYHEYTKVNIVSISFHFQLSSSENGSVLVSDSYDLSSDDKVHYAVYEGKKENLIPGYWEHLDKDSPKDEKYESPEKVNELQSLLKAKRDIISSEIIQNQIFDDISKKVAQKINQYNPENQ